MSTDLEDRLRQMYVAVAEHTVLDDPLIEPAPPAPQRSRRAVVFAAVAVVVLMVLALFVARDRDTAPVGPPAVRPYAVPTAVPDGFGLESGQFDDHNAVSGFIDLVPTADIVAFVEYSGGGGKRLTISATTSPTAALLPGGEAVTLGAGMNARWYADIQTLAWFSLDGSAVSVRAQDMTKADAELVANGLWYVDEATFTAMLAKDGYADSTWMRWTPPGDPLKGRPLEVSGSLQKGLQVGIDYVGWSYGNEADPFCRGMWLDRSKPNRDTVLMSGSGTATFSIVLPDGTSRVVPAAAPPGLPLWRFATAVVRDAPADWQTSVPQVTCDGGGA